MKNLRGGNQRNEKRDEERGTKNEEKKVWLSVSAPLRPLSKKCSNHALESRALHSHLKPRPAHVGLSSPASKMDLGQIGNGRSLAWGNVPPSRTTSDGTLGSSFLSSMLKATSQNIILLLISLFHSISSSGYNLLMPYPNVNWVRGNPQRSDSTFFPFPFLSINRFQQDVRRSKSKYSLVPL